MNENYGNSENQIQAIHDYDVLLGRGKLYDKHLGNQNFQDLVIANVERYFQVISSEEKGDISNEIVDLILHFRGGRFLKRGHHCWTSINPSDARKKVAQALQYQRRKQRKLGNNNSDGPERECCNVGMVPSPPDLLRQTAMHLNRSNFSATARKPRVPMGCDKYQLQQPPFDLVQSCALALTKNKEQSKLGAAKTSFSKSSIVQAAAIANIATCGKPTYSSSSKSLHRFLTKSRQSAVHQSTIGSFSTDFKTKMRGRLIPHHQQQQEQQQQQQQQQEQSDSSPVPLMSCATNAYSHDTFGLFSFSDMDLPFNNDYFEQDEPFSISATGEENYE